MPPENNTVPPPLPGTGSLGSASLFCLLLPWGIALVLTLLWALGVDLALWVNRISPGCFFHRLTGLSCPGCGGTRATIALLHGDVSAAIRYNLWWVPSIFILLLEYVALWCRYLRKTMPYAGIRALLLRWYALFSVLWFVGRNFVGI